MLSRSLLRQARAVRARPFRSVAPAWTLAPSRPEHLSHSRRPRWYSSTTESSAKAEEKNNEADNQEAEASEKSPEEAAKAQLEAKDGEIRELKDRYMRSVADFRNLQERTARDMASARDFAITRFSKDLVESIDNLDRALSAVPQESLAADSLNKELKDLHGGLKMTESILMQTLAKHGLVRFDPSENGDRFDPNVHEATFMTKVDGKEDGTVFNTVQKGFTLNGRVVRAAKVGVVKNS